MPGAVAGVDGCRGGWVAALAHGDDVHVHVCATLADVHALRPAPEVVAVDIPIGLLDAPRRGGRTCDLEARKRLGPRAASVFSPPPRPALHASTYDEVRGLGVSIQSFYLLPKIREADRLATAPGTTPLYESHPELAFARLAGHPMRHPKRTPAGKRERIDALQRVLPSVQRRLEETLARTPRKRVGADDVLDALALTSTAARIRDGTAETLPSRPERDGRGVPMRIWW